MPVWHASGALQPNKVVRDWTRNERRKVERLLRDLVDGVGRERLEFFEDGRYDDVAIALHLRRPATPEEEDYVGGARDVRCTHGLAEPKLWAPERPRIVIP